MNPIIEISRNIFGTSFLLLFDLLKFPFDQELIIMLESPKHLLVINLLVQMIMFAINIHSGQSYVKICQTDHFQAFITQNTAPFLTQICHLPVWD